METRNLAYRVKEIIVIMILASIMGYFLCNDCHESWDSFWRLELIMFSIWMVMWYGNGGVSHLIDRFSSWLETPGQRFALGILGASIYSTAAIFGLAYLFNRIFDIQIGDGWEVVWISIGVSLAILFFEISRKFLYSWQEVSLKEEKMRNELLVSRYEVLKNQINPHFIFNGLNALTELVYEDQDLAVKYIGQLSKIMRYVLEARNLELVAIREELEILESYIFLQKIRYSNGLRVDISIDKEDREKRIAPLVLQMLIENAIKHNEITIDHPLDIKIYTESDDLIIRNNLQLKEIALNDSTGVGLKNIVARYQSLSTSEVVIEKADKIFSVSIPMINQK